VVLPFNQKDWPNPQRRISITHVEQIPSQLTIGLPNGLQPSWTDLTQTFKSRYRDIDPVPNNTVLGIPPAAAVVLPFNQKDWPNPQLRIRNVQIDAVSNVLAAAIPLQATTYNPFVPKKLVQQVDPVPNTLVLGFPVPGALPPSLKDFPNPQPRINVQQVDPVPNNTVRGIPKPPAPFVQLDWPNPVRARITPWADSNGDSLLTGIPAPATPPIAQYDWVTPRRAYDLNSHGIWVFGSAIFGSGPGWSIIVPAETPNWTGITLPSGAWTPVSVSQAPGWGAIIPPTPPIEGGVT
jgi:hypothetical protein